MDKLTRFVVPVMEMQRFITDCMLAVGTNKEHAVQLADLLIAADTRGHYSHGLNRLRIYMEDVESKNCNGNGVPKILRQKGATVWVDGDNALGVVVGNFCTDLAVQMAREHGIGWVVANNSNHFGIAAYYPLRMAQKYGLVGMAFTNTSPLVFPNRAAQAGIGTNPLSVIAAAENGDSFELDMATSAVALGKIELAKRKETTIPKGWGVDEFGNTTEDPDNVAGLLPLGGMETTGGYKGTGLGMMVELFCGIFAGSKYGKNVRSWREVSQVANLGQCFVAIDPECFAPGFPNRLQNFLNETRSLKPVDPESPILIAGDPERKNAELTEKTGGLIYGKLQLQHMIDIAEKNNVSLFKYKELKE